MRTILSLAAAGAMFAAGLVLPTAASADSRGCRNTGTVVGGVAGALIGNGVSSGGGKTGGTIIGGLGGAVVGHEIAKRNCGNGASKCRTRTVVRHGERYRIRECMGRDGYWHRQ